MTRRAPLRLGCLRVSRGMQGIYAGHEIPAPICFEDLRTCTGAPKRPALASASITVRPHLAQVWGSTGHVANCYVSLLSRPVFRHPPQPEAPRSLLE